MVNCRIEKTIFNRNIIWNDGIIIYCKLFDHTADVSLNNYYHISTVVIYESYYYPKHRF